jgi:hypothetical protein
MHSRNMHCWGNNTETYNNNNDMPLSLRFLHAQTPLQVLLRDLVLFCEQEYLAKHLVTFGNLNIVLWQQLPEHIDSLVAKLLCVIYVHSILVNHT